MTVALLGSTVALLGFGAGNEADGAAGNAISWLGAVVALLLGDCHNHGASDDGVSA